MKKIFMKLILCSGLALIVSCASTPTPKGVVITLCKGPIYGTSNENATKVGESSAYCILWLIAWGDASTNTAAKKSEIKKIHHVDYEEFSILAGLFYSYTIYVYGE